MSTKMAQLYKAKKLVTIQPVFATDRFQTSLWESAALITPQSFLRLLNHKVYHEKVFGGSLSACK